MRNVENYRRSSPVDRSAGIDGQGLLVSLTAAGFGTERRPQYAQYISRVVIIHLDLEQFDDAIDDVLHDFVAVVLQLFDRLVVAAGAAYVALDLANIAVQPADGLQLF